MNRCRTAIIVAALTGVPLVTSGVAVADTTNALPAGVTPAVREAALQAGAPNPSAPPIVVDGDPLPGGGVQVTQDAVAYQGGQVLLTVANPLGTLSPASPAGDVYYVCASNNMCLYRDENYGTPSGQDYFQLAEPAGTGVDLVPYGFNDVDTSFKNLRSGNVRVHDDWTGAPSGPYFTALAHSQSPNVGSTYNDQASALQYG